MLSENIKKLRVASNLSQVDLAQSLGVSKQCVSNWENDYIQPSIAMLIKIAEFFKVTTDFLLDVNKGTSIDVSGLSDKEIAHIRSIIDDLLDK